MVVEITNNVRLGADRVISMPKEETGKPESKTLENSACPKCKEGMIVKGKSAYGCSKHASGCNFLIPFSFMNKKLTTKQLSDLISNGKTGKIKGFIVPGSETNKVGTLRLTTDFNIELEE